MNDQAIDTRYAADQNRRSLGNYLTRKALYLMGVCFPDPRDQDLLDRGLELRWRTGVRRRELLARH